MRLAVNALAATRGGAVTMLGPFLSALRRLEPEWQFTVYVSNSDLEVSIDGVTTFVLPTRGWRRPWLELVALERRARRDGAVVMLNLLNSGSLFPQLPSITWQRNPLYFDRRWLDSQPRRMRLEAALRRNVALMACRASVATVAPSQAMADYVRDWRLGRSLRVEVVSHGVDTDRFRIGQDRPPGRRLTIGVMGHAASHRGLANAVRVLEEVRSRGLNARLLLTVPRHGNPAFQSAVDDVAEAADLLGLSDHVVFGGDAKDPAEWYRRLDLLMIPSESESFCFPLVEAFASGVPVVTSGLRVLREIAGDVALHGTNPIEMAAHVLAISEESEGQKLRRREAARRRAEDFSWRETALKVRALVVKAGSRSSATDRPIAP